MSQEEAAAGAAKPADEAAQDGEQKKQDEAVEEQPRQEAWAARRDLIAHGPDFVSTLVTRDQFGQTGGTHYGDQHFHLEGRAETPRALSGPIPQSEIDELADVFRGCDSFDEALTRLRNDRLVILSGGRETGRRSAALMLLRRLGVDRMRSLVPPASFAALPDQVDTSAGYVLCDLAVSRNRPLREAQLLALREQLERTRAHLVITVESSAALGDVPSVRWEPPSAEDMLHAHVTHTTGEAAWPDLCGLTAVKEFLARHHRPEEIRQFALQLVDHHRGEIDEPELAAFGETAVATQVARWLAEEKPELRDKAFLVSLAVFDKAPYAVTAELADGLFVSLHKIQDPPQPPPIPVFGSSREERLRLAHADGYVTAEVTEWGPLEGRFCARFRDERTAPMLLEEVWNLHPSARPAFAEWIRKLADDRRPLVRTRAASAAALLATADLSSAMAHLIEPWADGRLRLATRLDRLPTGVAALVIGVFGAAVVALATATYGLIFLPLATPYLVAAVSRRSELRADEHAAGLGFAPQLIAVLHQECDREESRRVTTAAPGAAFTKEGMIARLLDSHPDVHTRLHRLQAHLESRR